MKKILFLLAMILTLCGCQEADTGYTDDLTKAQAISVTAAGTSEVLQTITGEDSITAFVSALEMETWTYQSLPDDVQPIGSFTLSQNKTILFGQTSADPALYDIAVITLYSNACIRLTTGGLDLSFSVRPDTAEYLQSYFPTN